MSTNNNSIPFSSLSGLAVSTNTTPLTGNNKPRSNSLNNNTNTTAATSITNSNNNNNNTELMSMIKAMMTAEFNTIRAELNHSERKHSLIASNNNTTAVSTITNTDDNVVTFNIDNSNTPPPIRSRADRVSAAANTANKAVLGKSNAELRQLNQFITNTATTTLPTANVNTNTTGVPPKKNNTTQRHSILNDAADDSSDSDNNPSDNLNYSTATTATVTATSSSKVSNNNETSILFNLLNPGLFPIPFESTNKDTSKTRQFNDLKDMLLMFESQLLLCAQQDADNGDNNFTCMKAFIQYEHFIIQFSTEKGFKPAQEYHWKLFEQIYNKRHDLVRDGPFDPLVMRDVDNKYPYSQSQQIPNTYYNHWNNINKTSSNKYNNKNKNIKGKISNPCKIHPNGEHQWEQCSKNPDSVNYGKYTAAKSSKGNSDNKSQ